MVRIKNDIPVPRTSVDERGVQHERVCDFAGCEAGADHRAPKSKSKLDEYYWFCLQHVSAYNKSWDYFQGMDQEEIEEFRADAVTGHRPTWKLGERSFTAWTEGLVQDRHNLFEESNCQPNLKKFMPRHTKQQRENLADLDLDETATLQDIKMRYKQLVKRFHPDANGGDKRAEERFKSINEAYRSLTSSNLPQG